MSKGVIFSESFGWANAPTDLAAVGTGKWTTRSTGGGSFLLVSGTPYGKVFRYSNPGGVSNNQLNALDKSFAITTYQEVLLGFAFQITSHSGVSFPIAQLIDAGTEQVGIIYNADTSISLRRNGTVIAGPSARLFPVNSGYYYFWLRTKIDPTVGTVKLIATGSGISGSTILTGTGLNTRGSANSRVTQLRLYGSTSQNANNVMDWGSIVLIDCAVNAVDKLSNDLRVEYLGPNADGFYNTAWPPSTGSSRFGVIDEVPPNGDGDYIEAAAVNDEVSVGLTDPTVVSGTIHTIVPYHISRKTDAGAGSVQVGLRQNSTDELGTDTPLSTSYSHIGGADHALAPDGSAWDYTKIGSTELLLKRTA